MDAPNEIVYTVTTDSTGSRAGTSIVPALSTSHVMRTPKELDGLGDGPNPEALFAMGYGVCFQGVMGLAAKELGIDTRDSIVRTTIGLDPEGDSFALTADIKVLIPGVELDRAQVLADHAHQLCPCSKATRGNVPVTITAVAALRERPIDAGTPASPE